MDNGRSRLGVVHDTYKHVKKLFRKGSRQCFNNTANQHHNKLNAFLTRRKMSAFWNEVKRQRRTKVKSSLKPEDFSKFYGDIMMDRGDWTYEQSQDKIQVETYYNQSKNPGVDGITAEHLIHGKSLTLCTMLSELYSVMLSRSCVPSVFHTGLIIPILKKSTLNPNLAKNYRPVTPSSIHTKLVEQTMTPAADISDNQYGFRDGRGTGMACSLLNDVITHCKYQKSILFVTSLDAEKCFDSICHISLFVKLIDVIPVYE